jgi:hypothetical protein
MLPDEQVTNVLIVRIVSPDRFEQRRLITRNTISHVMLLVEFIILVLYPSFAPFVGRTELCVGPKFIDLILHMRHMSEIPGVHVKKSIAFLDGHI